MSDPTNCLPQTVLMLIRQAIYPKKLNTLQEAILFQCWSGYTYPEIGEHLQYDPVYVRYVGSQLWKQLSDALGEKIYKNNFRAILNQYIEEHPQLFLEEAAKGTSGVDSIARIPPSGNAVKFLKSGVRYQDLDTAKRVADFYIERPPIESRCYAALPLKGALIRIKAPRQMGKTSLLNQILRHARQHRMQTVVMSLQLADADVFSTLDRFLQWFCAIVSDQLGLNSDVTAQWQPIFGSNYNCTHYFARKLLPQLEGALIIALDDVDVLFQHPEIAADVLGLLRAWCEKSKHSSEYGMASAAQTTSSSVERRNNTSEWHKLRLIVIHSTEVYIPLNQHQSPFNIGLSIELPEFTAEQVIDFAHRYELGWSDKEVAPLMALVGGKPNLIRLTLDWISTQSVSLEKVLREALTTESLYYEHLRQQFRLIQRYPELIPLLKAVMTQPGPVTCTPLQGFQLESLGLVKLSNQTVSPSCELYRQYFGSLLALTPTQSLPEGS